MKRAGSISLGFLAMLIAGSAAQEASTAPNLIGTWQSTETSLCRLFPTTVTLDASASFTNASKNAVRTPTETFSLTNDDAMIYSRIKPDGWDSCRYIRSAVDPNGPQP